MVCFDQDKINNTITNINTINKIYSPNNIILLSNTNNTELKVLNLRWWFYLWRTQLQFCLPISAARQGGWTFLSWYQINRFWTNSFKKSSSKLPTTNKFLILRSLKHNRAAQLIDHSTNPCFSKAVFQVVSISEALLDFFMEPFVTLSVKGVPQENWSMAVPTSHDRGIPWSKVLDIPWEDINVLYPCYLDAAGHWTSHKLMSRDAHTSNGLLETNLRCLFITESNKQQKKIWSEKYIFSILKSILD